MKIALQQYFGENHSWSVVGQNLARSFIKKNHQVHLLSTNGYSFFPKDLKNNIKPQLDKEYDMQMAYTIMPNFPIYLSRGKNKFGMWSIEFDDYFPHGFAKYAAHVDNILVPSNHTKAIFASAGIKEEKIVVVPHGVANEFYYGTSKYKFPEKFSNKIKILVNVGQPHLRKGLNHLLEIYGKSFTSKDDVVLIFKVPNKKPKLQFEVDVRDLLADFKNKYPHHADLFQITEYIEDISSLYRACDIYLFPSKAEAFSLSPAEAIISGLITITSKHGGALDFCTENNCLLLEGKLEKAPRDMLYYADNSKTTVNAKCFAPDIDFAVSALKYAVNNLYSLKEKFKNERKLLHDKLTWDAAADQIINMVKL